MADTFSEFTRIIGRGPTLSRPLTRDEARDAMTMVLDGKAVPIGLGGFLLVLRQRGETAEELAGFVDAVKARLDVPAGRRPPDVDWPT
ncbi:MAG: glycosyl transferase, partial [Rhodospirillaceae bacterium]